MFTKLLVAVASSTIAISAFAADANQIEKSIQLEDGTTVHVFADGKMAMENTRFGRAEDMAPGTVMQTKDGKTITMNGNETARLHAILTKKDEDAPSSGGN